MLLLTLPVLEYPLPQRAIVSSPFSRSRVHPITGIASPHLGIDLVAATGTPVRAAHSGRIKRANSYYGYGLTVEIESDDFWTRSAHLSNILVREGEQVRAGQVVGKVGSTGMSTGPHLHFELWIGQGNDSRATDPLKLFSSGDRSEMPGIQAVFQHRELGSLIDFRRP